MDSKSERERENTEKRAHGKGLEQMAWKIGETFTFSSQRHEPTHSKRATSERESGKVREPAPRERERKLRLVIQKNGCEMCDAIFAKPTKHMIFHTSV